MLKEKGERGDIKHIYFVLLVGLLLPFAVMAQESEEIEEIVVLGSHIKGGDITGVLPITSLSTEDIDNLGILDGDELFRSIPSQGFVGFHNQDVSGGINDVRGDSSSFNLRAVGTGYTLALINSRRMVLQPGWASEEGVPVVSANPNAIPVAGIQRVEVMRDGASALYGTDAIGGAINSILRGKVNKTTISLRKGQSRHTSRKDNSAYFRTGYSSRDNRTTISFFGDYRDRTALPASQRVYAASDDRRPLVVGTDFEGDTDFDSRSAYSPWGIFAAIIPEDNAIGARLANDKRVYYDGNGIATDNGLMRILPVSHGSCEEDGLGADPSYCYDDSGSVSRLTRFDKNSLRQIVPRLQRSNFFTNFEHQLNANVTLYGELGYYRARTIRSKEQSANLPNAVVTAPASSYWNPFGPKEFSGTANPNRLPDLKICGEGTQSGGTAANRYSCSSSRRDDLPDGGLAVDLIRYRPVDMGPRITEVENESWRFLIGGEGEITLLGIEWDWDSALLHSSYESYDLTRNRVSSTKLQEAIG
ncbi:MAG: TonB-dependent receptor plug domain-containing protein, partial [Parvibaculales bacterium]